MVTWLHISLSTHLSAPQGNQCEISHVLACVRARNLVLHIHVVDNYWLLSKQGICWPHSRPICHHHLPNCAIHWHDEHMLLAVNWFKMKTSITWLYGEAKCWIIEVTCFLKLSADKLLVFTWWQAQLQVDFFAMVTSLLFKVIINLLAGALLLI